LGEYVDDTLDLAMNIRTISPNKRHPIRRINDNLKPSSRRIKVINHESQSLVVGEDTKKKEIGNQASSLKENQRHLGCDMISH